jgi:hypothetical protein
MTPQQRASLEAEMDRLGCREAYDAMVASGTSPNLAGVLASRQCPATRGTDSDFMRKEHSRMTSMSDTELFKINDLARKAGINTHGKTYNGALGKYTDPEAWVTTTSDVKEVALKKGLDIDGVVKVNGYRGPQKKPRIAKDILDRLEAKARSKDKSLDAKCASSKKARKELREQLTSKHRKQ